MTVNDGQTGPSDALSGEVHLARRAPAALPVRRRQSAPAPAVTRAVAAVAAGAALQLGMSVLGRRMAKGAATTAVRMLVPSVRGKKVAAVEPVRDEGPSVVVTETMIYRRVIIRRD